ncbi:putative hexose carrier protein [Meredithblackwellia eburnea MCA 4105]
MNDVPTFMGCSGRSLVNIVLVLAANSFLLFGYDNGVMSGLITSDQFFATFGVLSANLQGTVVSLFEVGAFFGAVFPMFVGNWAGRKRMSFFGSVVMILGAILQATAYGIPQLIVGRLVSGFGIGALTATCPVWLSESSKAEDRGRDISIMLTTLIFGIVVSYWADYGFSYIDSDVSWRVPLALQIIFCVIICVLAVGLPDSPRWLFSRGRNDDAIKSLCALRGLPPTDPELVAERDDILAAIALEEHADAGWKGLVVDGGMRGNKRAVLACMILIFQQFTGTNTLTYYSTVIYEQSVGLSRQLSLLMGGFLQIFFLVASLITWYTIDRVGRRALLIFGQFGMGTMFLVLMAALGYPGNKAAGIIATIATFLFQGFFTWGTMATVWCYPSEVLPLSIRTRGAALAAASSWIFGFMIVQITPLGIDTMGRFFYILFTGFNYAMCIFVWWFFPETAGLSLEAVDEIFTDSSETPYISWRRAVKKSLDVYSNRKTRGAHLSAETKAEIGTSRVVEAEKHLGAEERLESAGL